MKRRDDRSNLIVETFRRRPHLIFFFLAALQALIIIPLTTCLAIAGSESSAWSLAMWHAHEMIFGFALAVMGGYFAGKYSLWQAGFLAGSWIMARLAMVAADPSDVGPALVICLYSLLLFGFAGVPVLRAAKTFRNSVFGLILGVIAMLDVVLLAGGVLGSEGLPADAGPISFLLVAMMVFAMGGRITAAATSGAHHKQGRHLPGVAQIALERAGLALLAAMIILRLFDLPAWWASPPALGVALVCALRLWKWQVWKLRDPAVLFLHAGFFWLMAGFFMTGLQPMLSNPGPVGVLHIVTIGAFGTFTLSVMARVSLQKARHDVAFPGLVITALGGIALAAVLRVLATTGGQDELLMVMAGVFWTLAWVLFLIFLVQITRMRNNRHIE